MKEPPGPRVLMIASEVESLARTGGLGDVVFGLSRGLAHLGADVLVVTPRYGTTRLEHEPHRWVDGVPARWGWGPDQVRSVGVLELPPASAGPGRVRICLLDDPGLYDRKGIYGDEHGDFGDNALRFAVMSRAALEVAARMWPGGPDVVHAHDWHAAFAVIYGKSVMGDHWAKKSFVFTAHNLAFQGVYDESILDGLHIPRDLWRAEVLEHEGRVNLLKGATALADRVTTVSPTYAAEIQTAQGGFSLDVHMRAHADKLCGIVNGIDVERWDPATDAALPARFDARSFVKVRAKCKEALVRELGLVEGDGPLFGVVARLAWQKGIDILMPLLGEMVERAGRLVVLGEGDEGLVRQLHTAAERFHGRVAVRVAFDPGLARRIYAGSDFFFVPSRYEPCGLTQLYAMRYGAIPIVTDVGGLHDTVEPLDLEAAEGLGTGTGFLAKHADFASVRAKTVAAFELHGDSEAMERAVARAMSRDSSWPRAAQSYMDVYASARAAR